MKNKLLILLPLAVLVAYFAIAVSGSHAALAVSLKTLSALFIIFVMPGIYWSPLLRKHPAQSYSGIFLSAFPLSLLLLGIGTTIIKLCGGEICALKLIVLIIALSLVGLFINWQRWQSFKLTNDLKSTAVPLLLALLLCVAIFSLFQNYFVAEPSRYWSLDEGEGVTGGDISGWSFPGDEEEKGIRSTFRGELIPEGPRSAKIIGTPASILFHNSKPVEIPYHIHLLLQKASLTTLSLTLDGKHLLSADVQKFIPLTCETFIPMVCRRAIETAVMLKPGVNELRLQFAGKGAPSPGDPLFLENLSGLSKPQFADYMNTHYQLLRLGPLYDSMEALDFSTNLRSKPFLYTWDLRSGLPGYTTANQPLEFFTDMLAHVLIGPRLSSIKILYLGKLFFLFLLVSILLMFDNPSFKPYGTLLYLPILFTQSLILLNFRHVEAADTLLAINFLLMVYFLRRGENALFVIAAFFTAITRNQGFILVFLCLLGHTISFGDWKRCTKNLSIFVAIACAYAAAVLWLGYRHGLLDYWKQDLYWENLYRFSTTFTNAWRTRFNFTTFNGWLLLVSCGYPALILFKKDKFSRFLLISIIPYYILICFSAYMKVYYTVFLVHPLNLIGLRNWMQLDGRQLKLSWRRRYYFKINLQKAAGICIALLAAFCIFWLLVVPPTDPGFNSRFPYLTNYLTNKGFVPPYKGLY